MTATIQKQDAQEQIGDGKLDSKAIADGLKQLLKKK
jgi:hypothetical protein